MKYRVASDRVQFSCSHCFAELESPISDAGQPFDCPTCGHGLIVPGAEELERRAAQGRMREAKAAQEQQMRKAEEVRRAQQAREAEARRVAQERERARAAEEKRQRRSERKMVSVPTLVFSLAAVCLLFAAAGIVAYIAVLQPLQEQVAQDRRNISALAETVDRNALAANRQTNAIVLDLESLRRTVNHNANIANWNNRFR